MQFYFEGWAKSVVAFAIIFCLAIIVQFSESPAFAQTSTTGSINGTVVDSTGALVPNATVTVKDTTTGAVHTYMTNSHGLFTAPFLPTNVFDVSATAPGLQSTTTSVQILNGQQSAVTVTVTPAASSQTVQVSANNAQLIDTQTSNTTTTFTTQQFQNLPMPGGDITTIALTVPGIAVNVATSGNNVYGAFESDGLPTVSNLVIINGADDNDPFLNINNSGSSNLTLGQQEIAQASVVQNGYSVQYGRQAGVIENFVTKGGTNRVHGLLQYNYNSSGLNANDFFNKHQIPIVPRPKAVSNQYAAQIGGPIKHDKLFFFVNTEGLRYILPSSGFVNFPTANLQNSIAADPAVAASAKSTYGAIFSTMKTSPSYATAAPIAGGGCGTLAGTTDYSTGGIFGSSPAEGCLNQAFVNAANLNREWLATGRLDWNISTKQQIFFRVTDDQGSQPAYTSLISPLWNISSTQPSYSGQLNDTYTFTPNVVNQLIASSIYYSAIFGPPNIPSSLASSPQFLIETVDGGNGNLTGIGENSFGAAGLGVPWFIFPQGRNVSQYQIVDGLAWQKGTHNFRFGGDFKRDNVTDTILQENAYGGFDFFAGAADFAGGSLPGPSGASSFTQAFSLLHNIYSAIYNVGIYAQDEWRVKPNLAVDYGIRFDRTGNPACVNNCYSHYVGGFPDPTATLNTPYNATLSAGHRDAFPSIEPVVVQPRGGFNWDLKGDGKTVIRGGVGLFADSLSGGILESAYATFPNEYASAIFSGNVGTGPGTSSATAAASASAVLNGFSRGATFNSITAALPAGITFTPPGYATTPQEYHTARYLEYSLQLQRQLGRSDAVILSYAGNHGSDLLMPNSHLNQFVTPATAGGTFGLPSASPDPRFATISTFTNNAISNYNGTSLEYKHIDRRGVTADFSYTWSHALDDISNGGGDSSVGTTPFTTNSIVSQISPNSVSALMYSSSDYDFRNNFVADLTYIEPNHFANRFEQALVAGWTVGGKAYWRSGPPFSVTNTNAASAIANGTGSTTVLADVLIPSYIHTVCNSFSSPCLQAPGIFNGSGGPGGQTNFGNVPRNSFRGPHYSDIDVTLYKNIFQKGSTQFQIGAQSYNVLNHPNFGLPGSNASTGGVAAGGSLGVISTDVGPPTGPYGSGLTSAVSGRVLVVQGRLVF